MGGREYSVCDVVDVDGMRWTCTSARALDGTRMRTRMDGIPGGGGGVVSYHRCVAPSRARERVWVVIRPYYCHDAR